MNCLITGSGGLVGSESVRHFSPFFETVAGVDNDSRKEFFGHDGSVAESIYSLCQSVPNYRHHPIDISDFAKVESLIKDFRPALVVHAAAQPSHDWAASDPMRDFVVNTQATAMLLDACRRWTPTAIFIYLSTNKVYGDRPNRIELSEDPLRFDFADPKYHDGIDEGLSIDQSLHSLFGAHKAAADLMVQEYGKYFRMRTVCFRSGCITGESHASVQQHGFLSFLVRQAALRGEYQVIGHRGKQVRDQIHVSDLVSAFEFFYRDPRCGEVYNIGGGRENSRSILESVEIINRIGMRSISLQFDDTPRKGDHACYYTNLAKFRSHYPKWKIEKKFDAIVEGLWRHVTRK